MEGSFVHSKRDFSLAFLVILALQLLLFFVASGWRTVGMEPMESTDILGGSSLSQVSKRPRAAELEASLRQFLDGEVKKASFSAAPGAVRASLTSSMMEPPPLVLPSEEFERGVEIRRHPTRGREGLASFLIRHGGDKESALGAKEAMEEAGFNPNQLLKGRMVELGRSAEGKLTHVKLPVEGGTLLSLSLGNDGKFESSVTDDLLIENPRLVSGAIVSSFSSAARAASVPVEVVDQLADLFSDRVEFRRDLQRGDLFSVMYTEYRDIEGNLVRNGPVAAASLKNGGRLLVAIRHVGKDGKARYFDENGKPRGTSFLRYPVAFTRISSVFTDSRLHPVLKMRRPHNGVDFAAPVGTPVRSVSDGVVIVAGYGGGSGKMVKIKHGSRYSTAYLHLSKIDPSVRKGSLVRQGQVIGAVGATGLASGPHLHFSLYDRGRYVDPINTELPLEVEKENLIPPSYLEATLRTLGGRTIEVAAADGAKGRS